MPYTPYNGGELPNLVNVTKRLDPDGKIAKIAELLTQFNPMLQDIPMVEGNLPTGHRTTVRTGIPQPTWRRLNYGVFPTKSMTAQVDDTIGMLEDYSEVDKDLAKLNDNSAEFRLSEDLPHIEGMSNEMAKTIIYGDTDEHPERFLGLSPRYHNIGTPADKPEAYTESDYLKHVINAGGTTADIQSSMWYINWGENTIHGLYPKGSMAGLISEDLGEQTLFDNEGGRFQGFRTHYQWKMGMCVRDWRYVVRIANIELANMGDTAAQSALVNALADATYTTPQNDLGNPVFYARTAVLAMLDRFAMNSSQAAFSWETIQGSKVLTFRGIPIRVASGILETEAVIA